MQLFSKLKERCCFFLGTWHPYKTFAQRIWIKFFSDVFAPVFHVLFPKNKCFLKPKLQSVITMFIYISMAYKIQRQNILKILNKIDRESESFNLGQNFITLFEFLLPTVCNFFLLKFNTILIKY